MAAPPAKLEALKAVPLCVTATNEANSPWRSCVTTFEQHIARADYCALMQANAAETDFSTGASPMLRVQKYQTDELSGLCASPALTPMYLAAE